jgi:hypothetical protein
VPANAIKMPEPMELRSLSEKRNIEPDVIGNTLQELQRSIRSRSSRFPAYVAIVSSCCCGGAISWIARNFRYFRKALHNRFALV